jgi:hypothetical protein
VIGLAGIVQALVPVPSEGGNCVLVCKLDMSTTDDEKTVVCMAGYLAMLPAWMDFELTARPLFDSYGVSVLHAKEFYDTKGDFAGWSRIKKETFIRDIQNKCILGRLDLGLVFAAPKMAWREAKQQHRLADNESAFGFCFRAIIDNLLKDEIVSRAVAAGETLTFVLESGDSNANDALRIFNQAKKLSSWHERIFYSFGFADKKSAIGLQIADFLAVTSRKYISSYSAEDGYPPEPAIVSILRDRIYLIDLAAERFVPDLRYQKKKRSS